MACEQTEWLGTPEYLEHFNRKVAEQRIPISGSMSLTHRCNLRCLHCYLGPLAPADRVGNGEMTTDQVLSVIDQVTESGCLFFLITGGEPLLRQDFAAIYRRARTNGLLVTVFSNGTLMSEPILDLFEELPPRAVEITLYGATPSTYERITGVEGSYRRCITGVEQLLDRGIRVQLKTMLMTLNRHEFFDVVDMAEAYGCRFRSDAALFPRLDGDKAPVELRVPPAEAVELELRDEDRVRAWREFYEGMKDLPASDALYQCGAGLTTFHVDPYGYLQPCLMTNRYKCDIVNGSFEAGWREFIPRIRERKAPPDFPCSSCEFRMLCGFCPPFFELENGAEDRPSDYLCTMGRLRWNTVTSR